MDIREIQDVQHSLRSLLTHYQVSDWRRSLGQVLNTLIPYMALWALMVLSLRVSYWLTLALALPTAGFMVRTFIIFHDCGHGSFFASKKANTVVGILTGILTFTPWTRWWHDHAIHHATSGDLDRRGVGDVYTMTVAEYLAAPRWKKIGYRLMRNPFNLFVIGAPIVFAVVQRIPLRGSGKRERASVWWTNLALVVLIGLLIWLVGWEAFLLVQIPVFWLGTAAGVWLFYMQHQFEGVYWERHEKWNFFAAGLMGCSYYRLPRLLQWFTGSIGFHHIHHVSARIPNYRLEACYRENPVLQGPATLTLLSSLKSLRLRLYDEATHQLVGWEVLKRSRYTHAAT
ncbi:MAG: fatty acid desaturase [Anaerolineales bacterium]|nr:fatty acid desaturase [Anaerolineales bacterium]